MKLTTKRIILRDITMKDAESLSKNANDKEIWYFTEVIPYPYKVEDAKLFVKKCQKDAKEKPRKNYEFGIALKSEKRVIGMISLMKVDRQHKKTTLGYWLGKKYRGKGIMTEVEKAILDFAFKKLKLNKVSGDVVIENKASIALFKKFNFRKVGTLKEELIKKGKSLDGYRYELLLKDYE